MKCADFELFAVKLGGQTYLLGLFYIIFFEGNLISKTYILNRDLCISVYMCILVKILPKINVYSVPSRLLAFHQALWYLPKRKNATMKNVFCTVSSQYINS